MKPAWTEANTADDPVFRVDDLVIHPSQRTVLRNGEPLQLGKLTFDLLLLLVETAPGLVTLQKMTKRLWAGRVVADDTVRQRIKLLRKALNDDPARPRYLQVVRGQGIRLIPPVAETEGVAAELAPRKRSYVAYLAATIAAVAITVAFWPPRVELAMAQSLAVLPFETLSPKPEDVYFADGFHNDLLTRLAAIQDLKVISRTSTVEYRNTLKNVQEISRELNVNAVLEGSIQRSGQTVRINAQLIDARNDRHLWAQVYDREVNAQNLFDIQAELAAAIAGALQVELSPQESTRIHAAPTANTRAYNQYLLGLHYAQGTMTSADYERAASAFRQAIEEDPEFVSAWAALAKTHSRSYFFSDHGDARREQAKTAIEQALRIAPDQAEANLALGYYRYQVENDYEGALAAWQIAEREIPGDYRLYDARAAVYARMGRSVQAVESLRRAIELDPRDEGKLVNLAWQYSLVGEYEKAQAALQRVVALVPDRRIGYERLAYLPLWRDGDASALREALHAAPIPIRAFPMEWLATIYERDFSAAIALLDEWPGTGVDTHFDFRPKSWFYGTTLKLSGDTDAANRYFRNAEVHVEQLLVKNPGDLRLLVTLADIRANLGDRDSAIGLATKVLELLPATEDAMRGPRIQLSAARALLVAGEYEMALRELNAYLSAPSVWSLKGLLPDPRFDPIRSDPRLIALIERHARS